MSGTIGLMGIFYLVMAHDDGFNDVDVQNIIILTLVGMPCLFTMIMSATTVTSEREANLAGSAGHHHWP